jgi:deoxyribose-phosphate aldolase
MIQAMPDYSLDQIERLVNLVVRQAAAPAKEGAQDYAMRMALHAPPAGTALSPEKTLARMIDHTLLRPEATVAQVAHLCLEARAYGFASVCVNPAWVRLCAELLRGADSFVCAVAGFPLGAALPETKAYEAERAIQQGAREVDMVINVGALKSRDYEYVARDIVTVVLACHRHGAGLKVIIETALLTDDEKTQVCRIARCAGADFVKTSTGFGPGGATVADVALMRRVVGADMGVKASGGIRTLADARAMIAAGATRIGASASVAIVIELAQ